MLAEYSGDLPPPVDLPQPNLPARHQAEEQNQCRVFAWQRALCLHAAADSSRSRSMTFVPRSMQPHVTRSSRQPFQAAADCCSRPGAYRLPEAAARPLLDPGHRGPLRPLHFRANCSAVDRLAAATDPALSDFDFSSTEEQGGKSKRREGAANG